MTKEQRHREREGVEPEPERTKGMKGQKEKPESRCFHS